MRKLKFGLLISFLTIAMMAGIISTGMACCFPPDDADTGPFFDDPDADLPLPPVPPFPPYLMLLLDAQEDHVLSRITGKSIDEVKSQLACKPIPVYLEENGISPDTFRKAMDEQFIKLVIQAEKGGLITKHQSDEIQARIKVDCQLVPDPYHFKNPGH